MHMPWGPYDCRKDALGFRVTITLCPLGTWLQNKLPQ